MLHNLSHAGRVPVLQHHLVAIFFELHIEDLIGVGVNVSVTLQDLVLDEALHLALVVALILPLEE